MVLKVGPASGGDSGGGGRGGGWLGCELCSFPEGIGTSPRCVKHKKSGDHILQNPKRPMNFGIFQTCHKYDYDVICDLEIYRVCTIDV